MGSMIDKSLSGKVERNSVMRTSWGGGGQQIRTRADKGGRGGQKRAHFCGRPIWMPPKPTDYIEEQSGVSFSLLKILPDFLNKPD